MERAWIWAKPLTRIWPALTLIILACGGGTGADADADLTEAPIEALPANLFGVLLSKTDAEVEEKVNTAVSRFFGIGTDEPAELVVASGYRCYYELPQDPTLAFIWAADTNDIRSEGMSYGMMMAVQRNLREPFDRLWNFAKTYMQFPADSEIAAWRNYFRWQGEVDAADPTSWVVTYEPTTVPAPDGDEYFAAALYLADRRWGSDGAIDYLAEANQIATSMLHNTATVAGNTRRFPLIHEAENMVTFVPVGDANDYSDPGYHLPAFYDLFAQDGPAEDSTKWTSIAETSRDYLVRSAHSKTGLHPDYANFDGVPVAGQDGTHDDFRYDAWRVVMNMAVDFSWFSRDPRMQTQIENTSASSLHG
jgi:oligosaccharide reducing-end xylanase